MVLLVMLIKGRQFIHSHIPVRIGSRITKEKHQVGVLLIKIHWLWVEESIDIKSMLEDSNFLLIGVEIVVNLFKYANLPCY